MKYKGQKITLKNSIAFLQGNVRYWLYYLSKGKGKRFIRRHILQQIDFRIKFMDRQCYNDGSCKLCGCLTTALQMANKACEKPCYPAMMPKAKWDLFIKGDLVYVDKTTGLWEYFPTPEISFGSDMDDTDQLMFYTRQDKYAPVTFGKRITKAQIKAEILYNQSEAAQGKDLNNITY